MNNTQPIFSSFDFVLPLFGKITKEIMKGLHQVAMYKPVNFQNQTNKSLESGFLTVTLLHHIQIANGHFSQEQEHGFAMYERLRSRNLIDNFPRSKTNIISNILHWFMCDVMYFRPIREKCNFTERMYEQFSFWAIQINHQAIKFCRKYHLQCEFDLIYIIIHPSVCAI